MEGSVKNTGSNSVVGAITYIFLFLLIGCGGHRQMPSETINKKPNIVLILIDDLGKEWISCYGAEDIITPNIDALAASGIKFNNVYCMPQCTPSRVTLLTGQYPFRHGWVNHWDVPRWGGGAHFDETLNPSLGLGFKAAGYRTCIAGKWQIDDFRVEPDAMINNGFDEYCMWTGYETGRPASAQRYQDPYLFTNVGSRTYPDQFGPDVFRIFIENFMKENADSSFFVYYPMVLTHTPFVGTPDEKPDSDLDRHKAMVRYTDKIVGQIVNTLEELNLRDKTLIIVTTDNGTSGNIIGSRNGMPVKGAKSRTTESGVCVPFVLSWPGQVPANSESNALIDFTDIYPTLLEIVAPDNNTTNQNATIDGRSFYPLLSGESNEALRTWIMSMGGGNNARLTENGVENQYVYRDRVLRNKRYKLYVDINGQADKFFDLQSDPFESIDLLDSLEYLEMRRNLDELMLAASSFPDKDNDPQYKPNPAQPWDVEITANSQTWKK